MKQKTLKEFIKMAKDGKNYGVGYTGVCGAGVGVAFADTAIDDIAWAMACDSCGGTVVYTWMEYDGKLTGCRRQVVKYGKKPGSKDGEDLMGYVVKYGKKYWMDEIMRCW